MTAIGTARPTAILSCLFRSRETGPAEDADGLLKIVGDGDEDAEDIDELLKGVGDGNEDDEEGDGSKGSAGDVIEDTEAPIKTFDD